MENLIRIATPLSAQYAPYNALPAFWCGFREYIKGGMSELTGIDAQAYDRGCELAMKVSRA